MKREFICLSACVFVELTSACSSHRGKVTGTGTPPGVPVQDGQCPAGIESSAGKIFHEEVWSAAPATEHQVMVWLRETSLPGVPTCPADSGADARCVERDELLAERQRLNVQELTCALASLDQGGSVQQLSTLWYEQPYHLTSGEPVPIGLAFGLSLSEAQIALLAQHPFVEKIEPWPGMARQQAIPAPPAPADCPGPVDDATPKLDGITVIRNQGPQPVVVELSDQGLLPSPATCDDGSSLCPEAVNTLWERTILNVRELTCVRRRIDEVVQEETPAVSFAEATGDPTAPALPPAAQLAETVKGFGWGLSWDEASLVAESPFVEKIWTSSGLQWAPETPGCPPDITAPIPTVDCTSQVEPIDGKISDDARAIFEAASSSIQVVITVRSSAVICPLPDCSAKPCPEDDAIINYVTSENLESQRCVRDLIDDVGGSSDAESFWLVDAFVATLTWEQIQAVAASPQVVQIEPDSGGAPPP